MCYSELVGICLTALVVFLLSYTVIKAACHILGKWILHFVVSDAPILYSFAPDEHDNSDSEDAHELL